MNSIRVRKNPPNQKERPEREEDAIGSGRGRHEHEVGAIGAEPRSGLVSLVITGYHLYRGHPYPAGGTGMRNAEETRRAVLYIDKSR